MADDDGGGIEDGPRSFTGLVLTGGGARAAYQVGALQALAQITSSGAAGRSLAPFPIVAGVSAGAVNAAALAAGADDFQGTVARLARIWSALVPGRVYRTDAGSLAGIGARWLRDLTTSGLFGEETVNHLLDTTPLRRLLRDEIPIERVQAHVRSGLLRGLAVSATDYSTGTGVTFFEGDPDIVPWARSLRVGLRETITLDHVMASAAIPLFFPPVRIGDVFFGDGCVRMLAPVSPAIHLGADRIVAIAVQRRPSPGETARRQLATRRGSLPLSEVLGTLMNALFLDTLELDTERLERINHMLGLIPSELRSTQHLRTIPLLVLRPSEDVAELAEHLRLPPTLRYLLHGLGPRERGKELLSYLAFEPTYVRKLMALGFDETMARRREIEAFLGAPDRELKARTRVAAAGSEPEAP